MNTLVFVVKGQMITRTDNLLPVAKCRNLYRAKFDFKNANWDGIKTALFKMGNKPKAVILDENDECDVPWEFFDTEETAYGTVSVFCGDLVTANKESVLVMQSGYEQSEASEPPTPDIYNQILEVVDDTKQIAQSVRDDADKGLFNGKDGDDGKSAYEIAVSLGFVGTEQQWIDSLRYDHSDEFAQLTGQVRQALETEGNRQNNAIVEMGTEQKEAITNEGTLQKKSVTDAGEEQVEFITEEGNKQTKAVADEGTKQLEAVNKAVEGIVADREQITQNKEDITTLKEEVTALDNTKADGIIETASGEIIKTEISSDSKLTGLKVFGKSEQVATMGINLIDYAKAKSNINNVEIKQNGNQLSITNNNNYVAIVDIPMTLDVGTYYLSESSSLVVPIYRNNSWFANGILANAKKGTFKVTEKDEYSARITVQAKATVLSDSLMCSTLENAEYEPYTGGKPSPSPDYPQEIKNVGDKGNVGVSVTGKNLLPNTVVLPDKTDKGIVWTYKSDGVYHISGTSLGNFDSPILQLTDFNLPPGTYRMINSENAIPQMVVTKSDGRDYWYSTKFTIEKGDKIKYWYCGVLNGKTVDTDVYAYLEFDTGIQPTKEDFEPYKPPQTLTLLTPNGLPGIPVNSDGNYTDENGQQWVCDEIDHARGKYIRRIYKKVFDGSEQIHDNIGNKTSFFFKIDNITPDAGLCNYGKIVKANIMKQEELSFSITISGIYLYTTKFVDVFKKELEQKYTSGNPVCVTYALKTPIETDLPPETIEAYKKLYTNYPTTIISNDENAGMEVSYVADTKNYINQKIDTINAVIVNTQKALL